MDGAAGALLGRPAPPPRLTPEDVWIRPVARVFTVRGLAGRTRRPRAGRFANVSPAALLKHSRMLFPASDRVTEVGIALAAPPVC